MSFFNMATPIIDWPVMRRKISRKGAWLPSDRSIQRIAQELATQAAERMSLYYLLKRLHTEFTEAYKTRRPYLDDRKIVFYGAVIDAVNNKIKKFERDQRADEVGAGDEDEKMDDVMDGNMDYDGESDNSSDYSGISNSDLPIPLCLVDTGKAVDDMPSSDGPMSSAATFGVPSPRASSPDISPPRSPSPPMSSPDASIIG